MINPVRQRLSTVSGRGLRLRYPSHVRAELKPHPDSPSSPVRAVHASATRVGNDLLLTFEAEGEIGRVALPPPGEGRADALWRHTCFEAFVAGAEGGGYLELNFAPSSQWAAYRFSGYREGMAEADIGDPDVRVAIAPERLNLAARVPAPTGEARIALTAVVEDADGGKSYWALAHPPGAPDFHHRDGSTLVLPPEEAR